MNSYNSIINLELCQIARVSYDIIKSYTATGDQTECVFGIICQASFSNGSFQQACVRDISTSLGDIENLAKILCSNCAMPIHLYDIVEDFIS